MDFKKNFPAKITPKGSFKFDERKIAEIIGQNRNSLNEIGNWIDEDAFKKSFFNYGIPDFIRNDINKPINNSVTYTDLIAFFSEKHFRQINYLEIGVSVGKNFYQLLNAFQHAQMTAFDIEEINPILENHFTFKRKEEWETPKNSIKKTRSSLKEYDFRNTAVRYLCGDVYDENSWAKLSGNKFDIVFSDALHSSEAILFEFEMLVKYNLLNNNFIIIWDDLEGKMKKAFFKIIRRYDKIYAIKDIYLLSINGWIGEHERPHSVGVISNFTL